MSCKPTASRCVPPLILDRHVRVSVGLPEANERFVAALEDILE